MFKFKMELTTNEVEQLVANLKNRAIDLRKEAEALDTRARELEKAVTVSTITTSSIGGIVR